MIILVMDKNKESNIFIDKDGVRILLDILNNYVGKNENENENDHDHVGFMEGLVSENKIEGYDFGEHIIAEEITFRFRSSLKLR